jgi:hypothetical protein
MNTDEVTELLYQALETEKGRHPDLRDCGQVCYQSAALCSSRTAASHCARSSPSASYRSCRLTAGC